MLTRADLDAALARHAKVTRPVPVSARREWTRSVVAALAIGGAVLSGGFFLWKSDAEATAEKVSADATHEALKTKDTTQDIDRERIDKQHGERAHAIDAKLEKIIDNQWLQYKGRRIKPNGD